MWRRPVLFQEFLYRRGLLDEVYQALENDNIPETVLAALHMMKKTKNIPKLTKNVKSEGKSNSLRNDGNDAYAKNQFQKALEFYNKALLYAPVHSRAMKLAFSNRSALLHKLKAHKYCLKDIETCFSLGCPPEIVDKLQARKRDSENFLIMEAFAKSFIGKLQNEDFYMIKGKRNPQIPCASTDIGVVMQESQIPKLVATCDIKVGSVVALEPAFVGQSDEKNKYFCCYYCQKLSPNLIPCDACCEVLFCDKICMNACKAEFHNIECKFIDILEEISILDTWRMMVKAVLKIKNKSTWKEFIEASYNLGTDRIKNSSINEIFDFNQKFSLLCTEDDKCFVYGQIFNNCFPCATLVHYLDLIPGYFPTNSYDEREEARKAFCRIMMFLVVHVRHTHIEPSVMVWTEERSGRHEHSDLGWFSMINKIKHDCDANLLAISVNHKLALVAVQPIKKGTELTLSIMGHWTNSGPAPLRNRDMVAHFGKSCECLVCMGTVESQDVKLMDEQKKFLRKINLREIQNSFDDLHNSKHVYSKLCRALTFLSDVRFTPEYKEVVLLFRRCLADFQQDASDNIVFQPIE